MGRERMTVSEVTKYRAADGTLHDTKDAAESHQKYIALRAACRRIWPAGGDEFATRLVSCGDDTIKKLADLLIDKKSR